MKAQDIKRFDTLESTGGSRKKIFILETIRKKSDFISNNLVYVFYIEFKSLDWTDSILSDKVLLRTVPEDAEIDFRQLEDSNTEVEFLCNINGQCIAKEKEVGFDGDKWKGFFEKQTSPEGFRGGYVSFRKDGNYVRVDLSGIAKTFDFVSNMRSSTVRCDYYRLFGVKTSALLELTKTIVSA